MDDNLYLIMDFNIDTTFKMALADFMRIGELIYIMIKLKKATFIEISLIRLDVSFVERDQYTIVQLIRSKTDT